MGEYKREGERQQSEGGGLVDPQNYIPASDPLGGGWGALIQRSLRQTFPERNNEKKELGKRISCANRLMPEK